MTKEIYYIYEIFNDVTQKRYIGVTSNLKTRMQWHFSALKRYDHPVSDMTKDCIKYGFNHFSFRLIDIVHGKKKGFDREDYYIRKFNTYVPELGYNGKGSRYTESSHRSKKVRERREQNVCINQSSCGERRLLSLTGLSEC